MRPTYIGCTIAGRVAGRATTPNNPQSHKCATFRDIASPEPIAADTTSNRSSIIDNCVLHDKAATPYCPSANISSCHRVRNRQTEASSAAPPLAAPYLFWRKS